MGFTSRSVPIATKKAAKKAVKSTDNNLNVSRNIQDATTEALNRINNRFSESFPGVEFDAEENATESAYYIDHNGEVVSRNNGRKRYDENDEEIVLPAIRNHHASKDVVEAARLDDTEVVGKDVVEPRKRFDVTVKVNNRFIKAALRALSDDATVSLFTEDGATFATFHAVWQMTDSKTGNARIKFPTTGEVIDFPYESVIDSSEYIVSHGTIVAVETAITGGDTYKEWVVDTGKVNDADMPVMVRLDSRKYTTSNVSNNATKVVL